MLGGDCTQSCSLTETFCHQSIQQKFHTHAPDCYADFGLGTTASRKTETETETDLKAVVRTPSGELNT